MNICQIDTLGYYIRHIPFNAGDPIPYGWTLCNPPTNLLVHNRLGTMGWIEEEEREMLPDPTPLPVEPKRVSKIDFYRLFTDPQKIQLNAWRKATHALTVEDYSNPAKGLIIQLEIIFQMFEMPAEFIELNNSDTELALMLLGYAGVFGNDEEVIAAEISRIKQGIFP